MLSICAAGKARQTNATKENKLFFLRSMVSIPSYRISGITDFTGSCCYFAQQATRSKHKKKHMCFCGIWLLLFIYQVTGSPELLTLLVRVILRSGQITANERKKTQTNSFFFAGCSFTLFGNTQTTKKQQRKNIQKHKHTLKIECNLK